MASDKPTTDDDKARAWSLRTWRERHDRGYFPSSEEHAGWRVYPGPPDWLVRLGRPTADDVVLEIGCGYGEWMIPLSRLVRRAVGVDIHEAPIRKAAELFVEHGRDNCEAVVGDGLTLPFPDEAFTLVWAISVFQHIPRAIVCGYLDEARRVTRPGGRGLFHFRNADNVGPFPVPARDIGENHTGDFSCGWTAAEVAEAAERHGWRGRVEDIGLFLVLVAEPVPG